MNQSLKGKLREYQQHVESAIDEWLPSVDARPVKLHKAIRYSMEAGGKRIRPLLMLAASELFPASSNPTAAAVAIECLHTYTLIHDDLPSIDDSDLRRGRPSCHAQFDEATAILAGDALLTYAFQLLSKAYANDPALACGLIRDLADASGSKRLIGGQMEDVDNEGKPIDAEMLKFIHENKTGALLTAALTMGLRFCNPNDDQLKQISEVGHHIGMTYQIVDDILDATSSAELIGKPVGNDSAAEKSTYVALYGIEGAYTEAKHHTEAAVSAAKNLRGNNEFLIGLIEELSSRVN
ncbi:MAG: polyprenyl synthetase family protein [Lentimonas sp.]